MRKNLFVFGACLFLLGCGEDKGHRKVGDFCSEDKDCEQGLCFESRCLDPDKDDDQDGFKNGVEVHKLHTNPLKPDTDDDGDGDADEVGTIENPHDTDGDGKIDAIESSKEDKDKDCIPDQYDPQDDVPDEAKLREVAMTYCQRDTGVCAGHLDKARARCEGEKVVCEFEGVDGFEEEETRCDGLDNDCDGNTDEGCEVHAEEFQVNTWTTNDQRYPSITSLPDGGFVVVWTSSGQDGSSWGVYGQRFDSNGNKVGSEFQVNTWTTGWQGDPSITSLSNGGFVVVWESWGQDGSNFGVYGRIFSQQP